MGEVESSADSAGKDTTTAPLSTEETALWRAWKADGDPRSRTRLILYYLPTARVVAGAIAKAVNPAYLEIADLVQFSTVGLIEAVDRFDPDRGVPFRGFAEKRVRGAIYDGIATHSELHAQQAYRRRYRQERVEMLQPEPRVRKPLDLFTDMVELALGLAVGLMLEGTNLFQGTQDSTIAGYGDPGELASRADVFRRLTEQLPEAERAVLELHYSHGLQFTAVADILGVSRGRISQLHSKALATLRQLGRSRRELDLRL